MIRKIISCDGAEIVNSTINSPEHTQDSLQLWHLRQFELASNGGVELIYQGEDISFKKKCPKPFKHLSKTYYSLELKTLIATQVGQCLLVVPHNRYYTDPEWTTPLPVLCMWESDWWPYPPTVIFRYGPKTTKFTNGKPFAQAFVMDRFDSVVTKMDKEEILKKKGAEKYINDHVNEYVTRNWVTADGVAQNNLYNVLSVMNQNGKLPHELLTNKKLKIFKCSNGAKSQEDVTI